MFLKYAFNKNLQVSLYLKHFVDRVNREVNRWVFVTVLFDPVVNEFRRPDCKKT